MDTIFYGREKRRSVRLVESMPVKSAVIADRIESGLFPDVYEAVGRNIGETGMFMEIDKINKDALARLNSGKSRMDLVINLPGWNKDINATAEVVWVRDGRASQRKVEVGVKFIRMAEDEKNSLASYISEMRGYGLKEEIRAFLEVDVSSDLFNGDRLEVLKELEAEDLEKLIPERGRAFFIKRAVILMVNEQVKIFATVPITMQMCEGHMPGFSLLPLGIAGWILSQCGEILISFLENENRDSRSLRRLPMVCKTGPVKSKYKGFLTPGDTLLITGLLKRRCLGISEVDTDAWLDAKKIIEVPGMIYVISLNEQLWG